MASTEFITRFFKTKSPALPEITKSAVDVLGQTSDILPDNNYWILSTYTIIVPKILEEFSHLVLPQSGKIGPIWNYLDAACSILSGLIQFFRAKKNPRPNATKAKGVVNVLNGTQLTIFTAINFAVFGGPAFAGAFFIGFVLSLDEINRAKKRLEDERYWLQDTLMQIKKLDELIPELTKDIEEMKAILQKRGKGYFSNWALQAKIKRLEEFTNNKKKLEEDAGTRICSMTARKIQMDDIVDPYLKGEPKFESKFNTELSEFMQFRIDYPAKSVKSCQEICKTAAHKKKEKKIKEECEESYDSAQQDTFIWFLAFVGMALLCIPGCQAFGISFISAASLLYLKKNSSRIISFFSKLNDVKSSEESKQNIDFNDLRRELR